MVCSGRKSPNDCESDPVPGAYYCLLYQLSNSPKEIQNSEILRHRRPALGFLTIILDNPNNRKGIPPKVNFLIQYLFYAIKTHAFYSSLIEQYIPGFLLKFSIKRAAGNHFNFILVQKAWSQAIIRYWLLSCSV